MPLLPVEEHELDRVSGKLVVARANPTRGFAVKTDVGFTIYWYQHGQYFAGDQECGEADVPAVFREQIIAHPLSGGPSGGPAVIEACPHCKERMNSSLLAAHVIKHLDDMMKLGKEQRQVKLTEGKG